MRMKSILVNIILSTLVLQSVQGSSSEEYQYYSEEVNSDDTPTQNKPVFSLKTDAFRIIGQDLQVNCSVQMNNNRFIDQALHPNCTLTETVSNQNCSSIDIQEVPFDINRLRILHCPTGDYADCTEDSSTRQLDNITIGILKNGLGVNDTGTYFCQYNKTRETEANFYLKVGYKPVGPENIDCISVDLNNLTCTWVKSTRDQENPLPVQYRSYFFSSPMFGQFDCPNPVFGSRWHQTGCSIRSASTGDNITYTSINNFTLFVNASNVCDSHIVQFTIKNQQIVKLSPPEITVENVTAKQIHLMINLRFNTKIALLYIMLIQYEVFYKSNYSSQTLSFTSANESNIKAILPNLIPYTTYYITVRIKAVDAKYWSESGTISYTTRATGPEAIPVIGGFSRSNGALSIYIRPITIKEKNSADSYYDVTVKNGNDLIKRLNVSWRSSTIQNISYLPETSMYQVVIRTYNDIGKSLDTSSINIPVLDQDRAIPANIVVEGSGILFKVSWDGIDQTYGKLEHIIVYWCRGKDMVCQSKLNWTSTSNNQTEISIKTDTEGKWIFAVSYQYLDGYNTGMIFSQCYFPSFADPPIGVAQFSVLPIGRTKITVKPGEFCSNRYPSRPSEYKVFYRDSREAIQICDNTFQTKRIMAAPATDEIDLNNLKPSTNYSICLSVTTRGGYVISSPQIARTLSNTEERTHNEYIIVTAVLLPLLLISIIIYIIYRRVKPYICIDTEIDLPKIQPKYKLVTKHDEYSIKYEKAEGNHSSDSGVSSNHTSRLSLAMHSTQRENPTETLELGQTNQGPSSECIISRENYDEHTLKNSTEQELQIIDNCEKNEDNISERDRTVSEVSTAGYSDVTLKSSQTSTTDKSSRLSHFSRSKYKRPSIQEVFETCDLDLNEDIIRAKRIDLLTKNTLGDINSKDKFIKTWVRKSVESLYNVDDKDSTCDVNDTGNSPDISSYVQVEKEESKIGDEITRLNKEISTYAEVDHAGSIRSCTSRQSTVSDGVQSCRTRDNSVINPELFQQQSNLDIDLSASLERKSNSNIHKRLLTSNEESSNTNHSCHHPPSNFQDKPRNTTAETIEKVVVINLNKHDTSENLSSAISDYKKSSENLSSAISDYQKISDNLSSAMSDYQKVGQVDSGSDSDRDTDSQIHSTSEYTILYSMDEHM